MLGLYLHRKDLKRGEAVEAVDEDKSEVEVTHIEVLEKEKC